MLAAGGLRFDDFGTVGALLLEGFFQDGLDGYVSQLAYFCVTKFVVADWVDAFDITQFCQQFASPTAAFKDRFFVGDQKKKWLEILFCHASAKFCQRVLLLLVSGTLGLQFLGVNFTAGKGCFAANHHWAARFFTRQHHVAEGGVLPVVLLDMFPAIGEERARVVQTDKKDITAPSQAIADVERRGGATR